MSSLSSSEYSTALINLVLACNVFHKGTEWNSLTTIDGLTALTLTCKQGNIKVLRELLKHDSVDVNCPDGNGDTALGIAIVWNNLDVVRELLQHDKVDVNRLCCPDFALTRKWRNCVTIFGLTPLGIAIAGDNLSAVRELLNTTK
ncbi:hypothetical protein MHU86_14287 [Fragilaria crotonensis]|nr:hypothetical protein MHU86_14287 [Fragilaria crotonensis]